MPLNKQDIQTMRNSGKSADCTYSSPCIVGSIMPKKVVEELVGKDMDHRTFGSLLIHDHLPKFKAWTQRLSPVDIENLKRLQRINDFDHYTIADIHEKLDDMKAAL